MGCLTGGNPAADRGPVALKLPSENATDRTKTTTANTATLNQRQTILAVFAPIAPAMLAMEAMLGHLHAHLKMPRPAGYGSSPNRCRLALRFSRH